MTMQYLTNDSTDGANIGQTATSKVSFYGASAVAQQSTFSAVSTTAPVSVAGSACFGFQTSAQFIATIAAINNIRTALRTLGFVA